MRSIPQPQRNYGPAATDAELVALLAGTPDVPSGLRPVADILAALTAEASAGELAAEGRALTEFRRRAGAPAKRHAGPRTTRLTSRFGVKLGAAATGVAVVFGGAATAAFANKLPAPIQLFAHETIGAPTPHVRPDLPTRGRPAPGGPSPGQPLAHGTRRAAAHPSPRGTGPGSAHSQGARGGRHTRGKQENPQGPGQQRNGQGEPVSAPAPGGGLRQSAYATGRGGQPAGRTATPPPAWFAFAGSDDRAVVT